MATQVDLAIVGGGSAAFAAAIKAQDLGARAVMVERGTIGGTCVNTGCIPTKHLLAVGETLYYGLHQPFSSVKLSDDFDFAAAIRGEHEVVASLRQEKYQDVLKALSNVQFLKGEAKFADDHTLMVENERIEARGILIATGSSPTIPPIEGLDKVNYLTTTEALNLEKKPASMVIIGAGPTGLEFAQMYAHFGTKVTVLQRSPQILSGVEPALAEVLRAQLEAEGITICTDCQFSRIEQKGGEKVIIVRQDGQDRQFQGEALLVATGRTPNTQELGAAKLGIKLTEKGAPVVDEELRTSVSHIFAAGDVLGGMMLEPLAAKEGAIAAENALKGGGKKIDRSAIPAVVFTNPHVATVGLSEASAKERGLQVEARELDFALVPKARLAHIKHGRIKIVTEKGTRRILGIHLASHEGGEIITAATFIVRQKLTIRDVIETVFPFPTLSEAIKLCAQSFERDITRTSCCIE